MRELVAVHHESMGPMLIYFRGLQQIELTAIARFEWLLVYDACHVELSPFAFILYHGQSQQALFDETHSMCEGFCFL